MPNTTLRQLGIKIDELSKNRLTSKALTKGDKEEQA